MSYLKPLKTFWLTGTSYFTVISATMYAISLSNPDKAINAESFLLILMLSFIMALGTAVFRTDGINRILAACLHGVIYIGGFAFFLWTAGDALELWQQNEMIESIAIGTLIFALVYAVCTLVVRLSEKLFKSMLSDDTPAAPVKVKATSLKSQKPTQSSDKPIETKEKKQKKSKKQPKEEYKNLFS